jgi:uncharacterized membrane protein YkvA (DUF1232 family)
MGWLGRAKRWARAVKRDVVVLVIAARDARTPLAAKLVGGLVAAYALSPIDLIPDFIPVVGYLDDLLIVPLGVLLAIRLIPDHLLTEFRDAAARWSRRRSSVAGAALVVRIWLLVGVLIVLPLLGRR